MSHLLTLPRAILDQPFPRHIRESSQGQQSRLADHPTWLSSRCRQLPATEVLWLFVTQHYYGNR